MLRRLVVVLCACAVGLCLGCTDNSSKANNPNNLEYGSDPPPKRDAPGPPKTK